MDSLPGEMQQAYPQRLLNLLSQVLIYTLAK